MNQPLLSIITVTYNAAKDLEITFKSIAEQTYRNIEYIVIDGASTDNTVQLISDYRRYIHTFRSEPDEGLYDAMNKGIQEAHGDYLCFLNAGDTFFAATTLQEMVASVPMYTTPDVIYGETQLVNQQRQFMRMRRLSAPQQLTWKSFKQGMLVCHQAFWAKRTIVEDYDLNYRFSADFDWCIRILKKAQNTHHSRLTLVSYLEEGLTTQNHKASLKERFQIMCHHYGWYSTLLYHCWFFIRNFLKR